MWCIAQTSGGTLEQWPKQGKTSIRKNSEDKCANEKGAGEGLAESHMRDRTPDPGSCPSIRNSDHLARFQKRAEKLEHFVQGVTSLRERACLAKPIPAWTPPKIRHRTAQNPAITQTRLESKIQLRCVICGQTE